MALCWGFRRLRCRSATAGRLRPGVQILAPRFREDLCLDAGEVVEAAALWFSRQQPHSMLGAGKSGSGHVFPLSRAIRKRGEGKKTVSARQRGRTTPAKQSASPTLGEQVLALADGKTQKEITAAALTPG